MTDGFSRNDDDRFVPLTEAERSTGDASVVVPEDEETAILNPVATLPRRVWHRQLGFPSKVWPYLVDAENASLLVCRFEKRDGSKTFAIFSPWRRADGSEHWQWKCPPGPRPLYKLPDVVAHADAPVVICEGEKATDAAALIFPDRITTCWQGGANAVRLSDFSPLARRHVTFWPDNDKPGRAAASELIPILFGLGCTVDIIDAEQLSATVPDHPEEKREPVPKWDAADAEAEWTDHDAFRRVVSQYTAAAKAPPAYRSFGRFRMDGNGLYAPTRNKQDGVTDSFVATAFEVLGSARSPEGRNWGTLLRWNDRDGRVHTRLVFAEELHASVAQLTGSLAKDGLRVERGRGSDLADYLNGCDDLPKVLSVDRTGWHDVSGRPVFVLPDEAIGDTGAELVILTGTSTAAFATKGDLNNWAQGVGTLVCGHSRPMLMVSAAFASTLLRLLGREGGGLSLYGPSSTGKSTGIEAAASVWGRGATDGFVHTWRATSNGIEAIAARHSDLPLCLDEFGQVDARDVGTSIYQTISGAGKVRATKEGRLQVPQSWTTFVLSTGEKRLRDKLQEEGKRPMAGQLVRLLEVPADAGLGFGAFDHGGASGEAKDLADTLKHAARTHYGTAGPEFVRRLIAKGVDEVVREAGSMIAAFARDHVPPGADGQVRRAADTFALVGYAGELAISLGVLPWAAGEARDAAVTCFEAWLDDRGGVDSHEVPEAIERIRSFIERYGTSRFDVFPAGGRASSALAADRAGYRRGAGAGTEWLVLPGVWKDEVLQELDTKSTRRALIEKGLLRSNGKHQCVVKVSGKSERFYVVRLDAAGPDDREDAEPRLI